MLGVTVLSPGLRRGYDGNRFKTGFMVLSEKPPPAAPNSHQTVPSFPLSLSINKDSEKPWDKTEDIALLRGLTDNHCTETQCADQGAGGTLNSRQMSAVSPNYQMPRNSRMSAFNAIQPESRRRSGWPWGGIDGDGGSKIFIGRDLYCCTEANFVFTDCEGTIGGPPMVFFDLSRVNDSKIVEHWETVLNIPADLPHDNDKYYDRRTLCSKMEGAEPSRRKVPCYETPRPTKPTS